MKHLPYAALWLLALAGDGVAAAFGQWGPTVALTVLLLTTAGMFAANVIVTRIESLTPSDDEPRRR